MQEALIKAYLKRRGFTSSVTYLPDSLGFPPHWAYAAYREWVFAWVGPLTASLPPR